MTASKQARDGLLLLVCSPPTHLRQAASKSLDTSWPRMCACSNELLLLLLLLVLLLLLLLLSTLPSPSSSPPPPRCLSLLPLLLLLPCVWHQERLSAKRMNSSPYHSARGAPVLRLRQPVSHTMQLCSRGVWCGCGRSGKQEEAGCGDRWKLVNRQCRGLSVVSQ